jgi:type I restriction enzyme S subunit
MNYVVLSEVAKIIMGQSPPSSTYNSDGNGLPFFQGKADFGDIYPRPRVYCSKPNKIAEPGDILITVRAPVGPTNLNRERSCIGRGLSALRVDTNLDRNYLFYFLRYYEPELAKAGTGSTFSAISREDLETIKLPHPPLPEQQRVAAILQKADRLRSLRRYARQLSGGYLQSVFVEMFGNPVSNPSNFPIVKLSDIGTLDRGISKNRPRNAPELYEGPYPFVQTGDIANSSEYISSYKQTYSESGLNQSKLWPEGTLCITIAANIAKTSILTFNSCFPDSIVGFIPNSKTKNEFVQIWFAFMQKKLEEIAPESAQKNINLEILRELPIALPSIEAQIKFTQIAQKHYQLQIKNNESSRQAEHLFQSLLQMAFQGEL